MINRGDLKAGLKVRLDKSCGFIPKETSIGANFEYIDFMVLANQEIYLFKNGFQGFYCDLEALNECFTKVVVIKL